MALTKKPMSIREVLPVRTTGSGASASTKSFGKKPGTSFFAGKMKFKPKKTLHRQGPVQTAAARIEELVDVIAEHVPVRPLMRRLLKRKLAEKLSQQQAQSSVHRLTLAASDNTPSPVLVLGDVLTTQEAADLVGVSRPYLVRFVDNGAIPLFQLVGNQRRVLKSAVLTWWQEERDGRRRAMRLLADDIAEELRG